MKKGRFIFLLLFIFGTNFLSGQNTFTLSDTTFERSSSLLTHSIRFYPDSIAIRPESFPFIDSIGNFLQKNPRVNLHVEVGLNKYERTNYAWERSHAIVDYLKYHGIDSSRVSVHWMYKSHADDMRINTPAQKIAKDSLSFLTYETEFFIYPDIHFFTLADTTLAINDLLCTYAITFSPAQSTLLPESFPFLNAMANFLLQHSRLTVKIEVYSNQLFEAEQNYKLTRQRADSIEAYLIRKGVPKRQMIAYGYGSNFPLYHPSEIAYAKTKEEQEKLYRQNERVEFVIKNAAFQFSDKQFIAGSTIVASSIRFQLNKDSLLPVCYPFLDSVADFLRAHPNMVMEVGVHTDSRARNDYGSSLSQRRALSIANYLIKKGVPKTQVVGKGYGETQPFRMEDGTVLTEKYIMSKKSKEEQEKLFAMNRRVEFKILYIGK